MSHCHQFLSSRVGAQSEYRVSTLINGAIEWMRTPCCLVNAHFCVRLATSGIGPPDAVSSGQRLAENSGERVVLRRARRPVLQSVSPKPNVELRPREA